MAIEATDPVERYLEAHWKAIGRMRDEPLEVENMRRRLHEMWGRLSDQQKKAVISRLLGVIGS